MKIAVTGAAGYLGRVLMPMLEADDAVESVVAIDVAPPPPSKKMSYVRRDVRDPAILGDIEGCDALVHLAFIVMPIHSEEETDSINVGGSKNVFSKAAKAGIRKIVHLSSVAAYGGWQDNPVPLYEDSPLRPMKEFYYSRTKGAVEAWLNEFEKKYPDINVVRLRPCIFIGPKINNMMTEMVNQKRIPKFRGFDPLVQFVWDEDVCGAIILGLKKDVRGAFNIAGDDPITMDKVAEIVGGKTVTIPYSLAYWGAKIAWALHLHKYSHGGWLEIARYSVIANCDKAKQQLGWTCTHNSSSALERFLKEMR